MGHMGWDSIPPDLDYNWVLSSIPQTLSTNILSKFHSLQQITAVAALRFRDRHKNVLTAFPPKQEYNWVDSRESVYLPVTCSILVVCFSSFHYSTCSCDFSPVWDQLLPSLRDMLSSWFCWFFTDLKEYLHTLLTLFIFH